MAGEAEHEGMWKCSDSLTWKISEKGPKNCSLELFMEALVRLTKSLASGD